MATVSSDDSGGTAGADESETRLRILEAGSECLARFGNEKTSLQDVADTAGLSRGTIYRYFQDRAALFSAIMKHEYDMRVRRINARVDDVRTFEEIIAVVVEEMAAAAWRYRTREHLLNRDRGLAEFFFLGRRRNLQTARALIGPHVERAHAAGELGPDVEVDSAVEWIGICLSTVATLVDARTFALDDPAAVGKFYARHICRGLVREPEQTV